MLPTLEAYERMVYGIPSEWECVERSTLVLVRHGAALATVRGEVRFVEGTVLRVAQMLNLAAGVIETYSYEVLRGGEKVFWYDPQPHPDDSSLASTFPHHQHVPPDIKRNRLPARGLSFERPNLPKLIDELSQGIQDQQAAAPKA
jgi:hypothetical protein